MSAAILNTMVDDGPSITYNPAMRRVFEDHLEYLRHHDKTISQQIPPDIAHISHGDLTRVLDYLEIKREYHWVIMRVNKYHAPHEYQEEVMSLLVPDVEVINRMIKMHRANQRILSRRSK